MADASKTTEKSAGWHEGFAAAKHQAANIVGHFIADETNIADDADRMVELAKKCADKIRGMHDNGTYIRQK